MDQRATVTRRQLLAAAAAGSLAAACAPAAQPAPREAAPPAPAAPKPAWEQEWDELVVAARKEGKLAIATLSGSGYARWAEAFGKAFPGIEVQQQQYATITTFVPKILEEQKAGLYEWDLLHGGYTLVLNQFRQAGALAPLRPLLSRRPEVTDDKHWLEGFEAGWLDKDKNLGYNFAVRVSLLAVNGDLVRDGEIKTVDDLANPKWKGKILWADVRSGFTAGPLAATRLRKGDEIIRKLMIDQEPGFQRDNRMIAEALIRGRYAIASGVTKSVLQTFLDAGEGRNIRFIDVPDYSILATSDTLWHAARAPHPAAARLFLNWTLSREGQEVLREHAGINSRRTDVRPASPEEAAKPGQVYVPLGREEYGNATADMTQHLLKLLGQN